MSGTYNKCQKETTCQSFTHVPRNGGKNQPVLLEHILPVVVNAPTVCSNSLQACSWLDLATRETSWDTRAIRFDLPSEPTLEIPKSQFDHDEEEDRPLLAQVARFARAHSIRMPDSKQHQRVRKSPCERGRRTIRHGVLGIGRAQTEKKILPSRPQVLVRTQSLSSIPPHSAPLPQKPLRLEERKILESARIPPKKESANLAPESILPRRIDSRGTRLGEMMTGKLSPASVYSLERQRARSSITTTNSSRLDDASSIERSYIPIGLGIMSEPTSNSASSEQDETDSDDVDDWSDESVYSQDSRTGSIVSSASDSSATTWTGPDQPEHQGLPAPPALNKAGLKTETMSSQRILGSPVQSLRQKWSTVFEQENTGISSDQRSFRIGKDLSTRPSGAFFYCSEGRYRTPVPPPGRLSERDLLLPSLARKSQNSLRHTQSLQNLESTDISKHDSSEYTRGELINLQRVGEEARLVREPSRLFVTNPDCLSRQQKDVRVPSPQPVAATDVKKLDDIRGILYPNEDSISESPTDILQTAPWNSEMEKTEAPNLRLQWKKKLCSLTTQSQQDYNRSITEAGKLTSDRHQFLSRISKFPSSKRCQDERSIYTNPNAISPVQSFPLKPKGTAVVSESASLATSTTPDGRISTMVGMHLPATTFQPPAARTAIQYLSSQKDPRMGLNYPNLAPELSDIERGVSIWEKRKQQQHVTYSVYTRDDGDKNNSNNDGSESREPRMMRTRTRPAAGMNVRSSPSTRAVCDKVIRRRLGIVEEVLHEGDELVIKGRVSSGEAEKYPRGYQDENYDDSYVWGGYEEIFDLYADPDFKPRDLEQIF